MAESPDALPERVDRIERKLDALSSSVDRRFDEVSEHFVEQRQYTEFAFERLDQKMTVRFDRLEGTMTARFERLERKLDQFIDGQSPAARGRRFPRQPKKG
jgi:hypothetical protein